MTEEEVIYRLKFSGISVETDLGKFYYKNGNCVGLETINQWLAHDWLEYWNIMCHRPPIYRKSNDKFIVLKYE